MVELVGQRLTVLDLVPDLAIGTVVVVRTGGRRDELLDSTTIRMLAGFRILRSADDRPRIRVVLAEAVIVVLEVAIRRVVESKVLSGIRNVLHRRGRRVEFIPR